MVAANKICYLLGVFQVNGISGHADGIGFDGLFTLPGGNGAHQGGIQTAAEQEANLGISHQPFLNTGHQLVVNVPADGFQIVMAVGIHCGNIIVADEFTVSVVMSGGEGEYLFHKAHQVLGFAGKYNGAGLIVAIIKRTDTDGIPSCNELLLFAVIQNAGVLGIQHGEHLHAVLKVQREQNLAITVTFEGVFSTQFPAEFFKAIDFAVADNGAGI